MIPFNFLYCRPTTLGQAYDAFLQLKAEGKSPMYYGGGSEIITMSRAGSIKPGAVIDLKRIPECVLISIDNEALHIGAACNLNQIKESNLFPLLGLACGRIADHTNQCRITLGGNLCGTIAYHETSLPLLLCDATVTILGKHGFKNLPFAHIFSGSMRLAVDELLVSIHIPRWALDVPHFHAKHTNTEKIDYPIVSMAAIRVNGKLRVAFSGICSEPFRNLAIEDVLNDGTLDIETRAKKAVELLPEPAKNDVFATSEYRQFVMRNTIKTLLEEVDDAKI